MTPAGEEMRTASFFFMSCLDEKSPAPQCSKTSRTVPGVMA